VTSFRFAGLAPIAAGVAVIFWATWEFLVTGAGRPPIFQRGRHLDDNAIAIKFRCVC
jgi:hypothetical protein